MEVGKVVEVAAVTASVPGTDGRYKIPVKEHQGLLDSGSC